jgi:hypothetical protein
MSGGGVPPGGPPQPPSPPAPGPGGGYQRTTDIGQAENFARGLGVGTVLYCDQETPTANVPAVIRAHISQRATTDVPEFVSEVFAQKLVGVTSVHPDVEQLYLQLGGRNI